MKVIKYEEQVFQDRIINALETDLYFLCSFSRALFKMDFGNSTILFRKWREMLLLNFLLRSLFSLLFINV
jgi:hypothetical protein